MRGIREAAAAFAIGSSLVGCGEEPAPGIPVAFTSVSDVGLYDNLAAQRREVREVDGALVAPLPTATLQARFDRGGFVFEADGTRDPVLAVRLGEWGRSERVPLAQGVARMVPSSERGVTGVPTARLEIDRGPLVEWFEGRDDALAHGWTAIERPPGDGPLAFELVFDGAERVVGSGGDVAITDATGEAWALGGLAAWDANGLALPIEARAGAGRVDVIVDDRHAAWPVTVDPIYTVPAVRILGSYLYFGQTVAFGDVDGDGYDDLITGSTSQGGNAGQLRVFHGAPLGLETVSHTILLGGPSVGSFGLDVRVLDANADGIDDLAVRSTAVLSVFHGTPFGLSVSSSRTLPAADFAAGDITGDGYDDLVVKHNPGSGSTLKVYPGGPTGISALAASTLTNFNSDDFTVADIEGNGFSDVIVSLDAQVKVYPGTPSGMALTSSTSMDLGDYTETIAVGGVGDVNGDGIEDLGTSYKSGSSNNGRIYFGTEFGIDEDLFDTFNGNIGAPRPVGDVNADGVDDFAVNDGSSAIDVYAGSRTNNVTALHTFGTTLDIQFAAGDYDGDGYPDAAVGHPFSTDAAYPYGAVKLHRGMPGWSNTATQVLTGAAEPKHMGVLAGDGDVNGDGMSDIVLGAPMDDVHEAYLYLGAPGIPTGYADATLTGSPSADGFGTAAALVDLNGDGFDDLVVGAPRYQSLAGRLYVFLGGAAGLGNAAATFTGVAGDRFGESIGVAGDVDGDGYDDIVVGAPGHQTDAGRAYLLRGSLSGLQAPIVIATGGAAEGLGTSVSGAGDVDADGYDDVVIGAPGWSSARGRAYIHRGGPAGTSTTPHLTISGPTINGNLGRAVDGAGDVDLDGYDDVVVGAPGVSPVVGVVRVYRGAVGAMSDTPATTLSGGVRFGSSVAGIGDVTGDGRSEILVGRPASSGNAYVYAGTSDGVTAAAQTTLSGGEEFGAYVGAAGDVNGDGMRDVLVGSYGRAHVFRGYDSAAVAAILAEGGPFTTDEGGGAGALTFRLSRPPTAAVTIPLSIDDATEVSLSHQELTFDDSDWFVAKTVGVAGVDDDFIDGAKSFTVTVGPATSSDLAFHGLDLPDLPGTNADDDVAGLVASAASVATGEASPAVGFTVRLASRPQATVTAAVASTDPTEGTVSTALLTFAPEAWDVPVTVTVTGVNDALFDGPQSYAITLGPLASTDALFDGVPALSVPATNDDDEGNLVVSGGPVVTNEAGGYSSFSIVLTKKPTTIVTIPISSSDTTEATVSPTSVEFNGSTWSTPRFVLAIGVDDNVDDGDQPYTIALGTVTTTSPNYVGFDPPDVSGTTLDNDASALVVAPGTVETAELDGSDTFSVKLAAQPSAAVIVSVASLDTTEATVSPGTLSFTPANWGTTQTVTVTGVDDATVDGTQAYAVQVGPVTSDDPAYAELTPVSVAGTNLDGWAWGVAANVGDGVRVSESGTTDTFTVALRVAPTANVTLPLSSSDATEGSVSPSQVVFTPADWATPRTVTVTGVNDTSRDGPITWQARLGAMSSSDPLYAGRDPADVSVTTTDDEPYYAIQGGAVQVTEGGATDTFQIDLIVAPAADIEVDIVSTDPSMATVSPTTVQWVTANWATARTVTVTAVDDAIDDGNSTVEIRFVAVRTTDPKWQLAPFPADVPVSVVDNDTAGLLAAPSSGLVTTEGGTTATLDVSLRSKPLAPVTVAVTSTNSSEAAVSPAEITFEPEAWGTPVAVTVTGVDDAALDGSQTYAVTLGPVSSADALYAGLSQVTVSGSNIDDEGGVVASKASVATTEAGTSDTFTLVLTHAPTATVTVPVASSDTSEATVSPASLSFTAATWNIAQTVTVTGVDDPDDDGHVPYTIAIGPLTTTSVGYVGHDPPDVTGTNTDNDTAAVVVTPTLLETAEQGLDDTFVVVLASRPSALVTLPVTSLDTTEVTVSPSSLAFSPTDWNVSRTVTVSGVEDAWPDGAQPYTVRVGPAASSDALYSVLAPIDLSGTNADGWAIGAVVDPSGDLHVTESGASDTFSVALTVAPTATVTLPVTAGDATEGTVDTASLVFTPSDWFVPRDIVVIGVDDGVRDGPTRWLVRLGAMSSADTRYDTFDPADVGVVTHDDEAYIQVSGEPLTTSEAGATDTLSVVLLARPDANVEIDLETPTPSEISLSAATLVFTPANWSVGQTVIVSGVDDSIDDGNKTVAIRFTELRSDDSDWSDVPLPADLLVLNVDDDVAGLHVTPIEGLVTEEDGGNDELSVRLTSRPLADVTVELNSSDVGEGELEASTLVYTPVTWATPRKVDVLGVDDDEEDGDADYQIEIVTSSADPLYDQRYLEIDATNVDDDIVDTGDTGTDTGDTATDTGDTGTDTGDTGTDTGDTATDTDDTSTDTDDTDSAAEDSGDTDNGAEARGCVASPAVVAWPMLLVAALIRRGRPRRSITNGAYEQV